MSEYFKDPADALTAALDDRYAFDVDLEATKRDARWLLHRLEEAGYRTVDMEPTDSMVKAAADVVDRMDGRHEIAEAALKAALAVAPTWGGGQDD